MRPCSTGWEEHKRVHQPYGPRGRLSPFAAWVVLLLADGAALPVDAAPEGQITWASHVTLVPRGSIRARPPSARRPSCSTRFTTRSCSLPICGKPLTLDVSYARVEAEAEEVAV